MHELYQQPKKDRLPVWSALIIGISGIIIAFIVVGGRVTLRSIDMAENVDVSISENMNSGNDNFNAENDATSNWENLSEAFIFELIQDKIFIEPTGGLGLTQEVDLTGDGLKEGIFSGNEGNSTLSFILYKKDQDSEVALASMKYKDGQVSPISLLEVGRVRYQNGFKILPQENSFYTVAREIIDDVSGTFSCVDEGLQVYTWNPSIELFEWNSSLTEKYTFIECL